MGVPWMYLLSTPLKIIQNHSCMKFSCTSQGVFIPRSGTYVYHFLGHLYTTFCSLGIPLSWASVHHFLECLYTTFLGICIPLSGMSVYHFLEPLYTTYSILSIPPFGTSIKTIQNQSRMRWGGLTKFACTPMCLDHAHVQFSQTSTHVRYTGAYQSFTGVDFWIPLFETSAGVAGII